MIGLSMQPGHNSSISRALNVGGPSAQCTEPPHVRPTPPLAGNPCIGKGSTWVKYKCKLLKCEKNCFTSAGNKKVC
jgi:hypothetical protein